MDAHTEQAVNALEYIRAHKVEKEYKGNHLACAKLVAMQTGQDVRFLTSASKKAVKEILDFLELCYNS